MCARATIHTFPVRFRTIHAFPRRSQPWTKHDSRLATEKKLKTPFSKRILSFTSFKERKCALIRVAVLNPKYGVAARIRTRTNEDISRKLLRN
jgi:hypothetical protein